MGDGKGLLVCGGEVVVGEDIVGEVELVSLVITQGG